MDSIKSKLKAVDFFCSGGGMTHGFRTGGIKVIGGIDIDPSCKMTYEKNNPGSKFISSDIKSLSYKKLSTNLNIVKNDDSLIFIGCSPCQYWSKIKTIKKKSEETKDLLADFQKFVSYFNPGYVVIENVPGILSRIDESPLSSFLEFLKRKKYSVAYKVIAASDYNVPQTRRRFLLIASRVKNNVSLPEKCAGKVPVVRDFIGNGKFPTIEAGHVDNSSFMHSCSRLAPQNIKRLKLTPKDGGLRSAWKHTNLQLEAYVGKDDSFQDIYGRLSWDKIGPTITTKFFSISNGRFAHPEQDRGLSLREGAALQTFPNSYVFYGASIATKARQIGNAVPPALSEAIAKKIIQIHKGI